MFLMTRTSANDVDKHKIKCKRGSEAKDQVQKRLLSTRTMPIEVVKQTNKGK